MLNWLIGATTLAQEIGPEAQSHGEAIWKAIAIVLGTVVLNMGIFIFYLLNKQSKRMSEKEERYGKIIADKDAFLQRTLADKDKQMYEQMEHIHAESKEQQKLAVQALTSTKDALDRNTATMERQLSQRGGGN